MGLSGLERVLILSMMVVAFLCGLILFLHPSNVYAIQLVSLVGFFYPPLVSVAVIHYGPGEALRKALFKAQAPASVVALGIFATYLWALPRATLALSTTLAIITLIVLAGTVVAAALSREVRSSTKLWLAFASAWFLSLLAFPMWNLRDLLPQDFDTALEFLKVALLVAFPSGVLLEARLFLPQETS